MKIHFHLNHPAHFHLFKSSIQQVMELDYEILITIVSKDILEDLVRTTNWKYINLFPKGRRLRGKFSLFALFYYFLLSEFKFFKLFLKERPAITISTEGTVVHAARLIGVKSVLVNEDDTKATPENYIFYPFANHLIIPESCDKGLWFKKRNSYQGFHELNYLNEIDFTPDSSVLEKYNLIENEYIVIRLAELSASHDFGKSGINDKILNEMLQMISEKGNIFISSERELRHPFDKYRKKINPNDIFSIIFYAKLFIGDSQTMAAESAILGTPSVRFSSFINNLQYLRDLEDKYELTFGIQSSNPEELFQKVKELLSIQNLKTICKTRRMRMLKDNIGPKDSIINCILKYS